MRIEVDPEALIAAGRQMASLGSQLGRLSDALGAALSGGIASGTDPAGLNFGMKYGRQAQDFAEAVAEAADAFTTVGLLVEATGINYRNADDASTIGGSGPGAGVSGQPGKTMPAHVPPGPNGVTVPAPSKWHLVQPFLQALPVFGLLAGTAMTWPSGHSAIMGITAMQWRNFATGFALIEPQLGGIRSVVGAQSIPESGAMVAAVDDLGAAISSLADVASTMAQSVSDFAATVQATQDAIRRLLDRLSISGLWDTVTGLLTGEGDDILREVARDIGTVLENFQQQVKGIVGLLDELTILIGDAATAFQKWIRPVLVEHFGDSVGNALADAVTLYTDIQVGAVTGLIGTVAGAVALADPDTWKGMAELAASVVQDPSSAPGVLANMGKEFLAWDKWSGEHPGRAAGEAAFNIGSLFVPGGALTKSGSIARGLNLSRRMLDEGRLPGLGEVGDWSRVPGGAPRVPEMPAARPGTPPASPPRPDVPNGAGPGGAGPGRTAEPPPGGRPPTPGAEGGAGQRAPVEQSGRGAGPAGTDRVDPGSVPLSPSPSGTEGVGGDSPNGHPAPAGSGPVDNDTQVPSNGPDADPSRTYSLADGSSHTTTFAPEQLSDNQRVFEALDAHGVTKSDFVDLINKTVDALTPDERQLINSVRDALAPPTEDTVMQKVIPPGYFAADGNFVPSRADDYLAGNGIDPERIRGSVTVAGDTAHLSTPATIYDGLRLDYAGSPFERLDAGTHLIRFQADLETPGTYDIPLKSEMGGSGQFDTWDDPFTGSGFTKSVHDVVPEYVADNITMRDGAEMWEVLNDGTQRLVATLKDGAWIQQGN